MNRSPHQGQTIGCILDWFIEQPAVIQQVVLRSFPPEMKGAYADALEKIAHEIRGFERVSIEPPQHERGGPSTPSSEPQSKQTRGGDRAYRTTTK